MIISEYLRTEQDELCVARKPSRQGWTAIDLRCLIGFSFHLVEGMNE